MRGALLLPMFFLLGCQAHLQGLVREDGASLLTPTGRTVRVRGEGPGAELPHLVGLLVDVDGVRTPAGVRATEVRATEGSHGLSAWIGVLEGLGLQVGLHDRNSRAWYELEPDSAETLRELVGQPVFLEGYVEGPHEIRVLYFRVLR